MMNIVTLLGRLARDPELKYSQSGTPSCFATIAVNRPMSKGKRQEAEAKGQATADFIGVKAFGKTAELVANYFHKGSQIAVEGRIQTGSYEKDGKRVYTTDVMVNRVHFVADSKKGGDQGFAPQDNHAGYYPIDKGEIPF